MPRVIAQVATAATAEVPIDATAYNEQSSGAQRSLKSASANDAAAGTGVRKVRVVYYALAADGAISGPFSEEVTLNGATAVAMVATNLALLERIEALAIGAGGVAAGAITLHANSDGTGAAIAVLASGDLRTRLGHHYVASGKTCELTDLEAIGGDPAVALVQVKRLGYPSANVPEQTLTGPFAASSTAPLNASFHGHQHAIVPGPARFRLMVTPANNNAQTTIASFGYIDR